MGGVIEISTPAQACALRELVERARAGLEERLQGIVVQRQLRGVMEMLIGARRDPAFGVVVTLGMGGKWVEILDDIAIRVALSKLLARRAGARLQRRVIDEGVGTQDARGREGLVEAIRSIEPDFSTILVISHLSDIKDEFPTRIDVVKGIDGSLVTVR
jgi:hypothetical protein